jgi:glycerate kinase
MAGPTQQPRHQAKKAGMPPRTILVCPDKFKGTLSAEEATNAISRALQHKFPDAKIIRQPLADGGEGSLDVIALSDPTFLRQGLEVTGPLRRPVTAEYLQSADGRAWIETSQACGLRHVPKPRRNPGVTTSIGVGQLIDDAVARGATAITLFLGGSATNDCGAGMAGALGYQFFSDRPNDFIPTGDSLQWVRRVDAQAVSPELKRVRFTAVYDVDNPLLGPNGASYIYATQKGATPEQLPELEQNMQHFADQLLEWTGIAPHSTPGAGAAGGLAAGAMAFLKADLRPGTDVIFEAVGFDDLLSGVDLVVTGEGQLDEQTLHGKLVSGVGQRAKAAGVPRVVVLCGSNHLSQEQLASIGVDAAFALLDLSSITLADAMYRPAESLETLIGVRF